MGFNWKRAIGVVMIVWGAMALVVSGLMAWVGLSTGLDKAPTAFAVTWFVILGMVALASTALVVGGVWVTKRFGKRV